jgi:hypothetical protein
MSQFTGWQRASLVAPRWPRNSCAESGSNSGRRPRSAAARPNGQFRALDQEWPPTRPPLLMLWGLGMSADAWCSRNVLRVV